MGLCHPVDHQFKVAEVAHAEATFRAEREDWNECASHLLVAERVERLVERHHAHFVLLQRLESELAVVACLPHLIAFVAERHELKFQFVY